VCIAGTGKITALKQLVMKLSEILKGQGELCSENQIFSS
jgi:hypothetical protein